MYHVCVKDGDFNTSCSRIFSVAIDLWVHVVKGTFGCCHCFNYVCRPATIDGMTTNVNKALRAQHRAGKWLNPNVHPVGPSKNICSHNNV